MRPRWLSLQQLNLSLLLFFLFIWIFPSLRLWLVGSAETKNGYEAVITLLPDIFAILVLIHAGLVYRHAPAAPKPVFWDKLFFVFFASNVLLGFILAADLKISLYGFRVTYFPMLFYVVGRLYSLHDKEMFSALIHRIFLSFFFFAAAGLIIYFFIPELQKNVARMTGYQPGTYFVMRMTSILWTPVLFGFLMALSCSYFCYLIFLGRSKWNYFFFAICWIALFLSVSRGPITAFLTGFIILSLLFRDFKNTVLIAGIMAGSACLINFMVSGGSVSILWLFQSAVDTIGMGEGISRVELWKRSWQHFTERPWGYGLGKAGVTAYRFLKGTGIPSAPYTTDGWYLKIACETGVYGLLSFLFLAGYYFLKSGRILVRNPGSLLTVAALTFFIACLQAVPSNTFDYYPYIAFCWLLMGSSASYLIRQRE